MRDIFNLLLSIIVNPTVDNDNMHNIWRKLLFKFLGNWPNFYVVINIHLSIIILNWTIFAIIKNQTENNDNLIWKFSLSNSYIFFIGLWSMIEKWYGNVYIN